MLLIIIQARTSSKRLPEKVLLNINNDTILGILIKKLKSLKIKKKIYVVTSKLKGDDDIVKISKKNKILYLRGSLKNVASRFKSVLVKNINAKFFLRISADSPLIDISLISKMIKLINKNYDIITNVKKRSFPKGQSIEIIRTSFFLKNFDKIISKSDKENVTKKMYKISGVKIFNYKNKVDYSKYSLALDEPKDKKFILFFFNKYKQIKMSWLKILKIRKDYEKN